MPDLSARNCCASERRIDPHIECVIYLLRYIDTARAAVGTARRLLNKPFYCFVRRRLINACNTLQAARREESCARWQRRTMNSLMSWRNQPRREPACSRRARSRNNTRSPSFRLRGLLLAIWLLERGRSRNRPHVKQRLSSSSGEIDRCKADPPFPEFLAQRAGGVGDCQRAQTFEDSAALIKGHPRTRA